jgi:hypothetical protein
VKPADLQHDLHELLVALPKLIAERERSRGNLKALEDANRDLWANIASARSLLKKFQHELVDGFLHHGLILHLIDADRTPEVAYLHRMLGQFQGMLQSTDTYLRQLLRQLRRQANNTDFEKYEKDLQAVLAQLNTIVNDRYIKDISTIITNDAPDLQRIQGVQTSDNPFYVLCKLYAGVTAYLNAVNRTAHEQPAWAQLLDKKARANGDITRCTKINIRAHSVMHLAELFQYGRLMPGNECLCAVNLSTLLARARQGQPAEVWQSYITTSIKQARNYPWLQRLIYGIYRELLSDAHGNEQEAMVQFGKLIRFLSSTILDIPYEGGYATATQHYPFTERLPLTVGYEGVPDPAEWRAMEPRVNDVLRRVLNGTVVARVGFHARSFTGEDRTEHGEQQQILTLLCFITNSRTAKRSRRKDGTPSVEARDRIFSDTDDGLIRQVIAQPESTPQHFKALIDLLVRAGGMIHDNGYGSEFKEHKFVYDVALLVTNKGLRFPEDAKHESWGEVSGVTSSEQFNDVYQGIICLQNNRSLYEQTVQQMLKDTENCPERRLPVYTITGELFYPRPAAK